MPDALWVDSIGWAVIPEPTCKPQPTEAKSLETRCFTVSQLR